MSQETVVKGRKLNIMNPGENIQEVLFKTLLSATSQNPEIVKQAEQNLSAWEKESNFYPTILNFYTNQSLDESARFSAILLLKNGIDKHWRKTQTK